MVTRKKRTGIKEDTTMKKIMTNIRTLAALLIASGTFAACSSDDNTIDLQPAQPAGQQVYTMTIQATKSTGDEANARVATRALALGGEDNKTLNATWATTENIFVKKGSDWATGSLQPDANAATATLKGSLSDITIAKDDVLTLQFPRSGELDYTGQVGTLEDIAAKYDYATATVQVASVSATGNIIPTEATTTFQNQQAIVNFTLVDKADGTTPLNATELIVSDGTNTYTVTPASATSEIYVAIPGIASQTVTLTATVGSDTYTYEKSNVTFANGKYYRVGVKMTKQAAVPTGAIGGKFTINSSGDKVYFSKGNLQYQASSNTWRFAENQYDYVGDATKGNVKVEETKSNNASISSSYTGWIDLFGWGTSNQTITNYGSAYQPWSTSTTSTHYGPTGAYNLTDTYANGDWGVNMGTGWRTLTGGSGGEWEYLFGTNSSKKRTTTSGILYAKATVNGVAGVILLPDDWSASYHSLTSYNTTDAAYTANSITDTDWSNDFEAHGAVFLPAAGRRSGTPVGSVGSNGYYWSSTALGTDYAYYVFFGPGNVRPENSSSRYYGYSVRLVRLVE